MTPHFCFQIGARKCKLGFSRASKNHRCSRRIEANQFIYRATHLEKKIAVVKNERYILKDCTSHTNICDVLGNLLSLVQFRKREKHP